MVAAAVAFFVALAGGAGWMAGYFAKEKETAGFIRCTNLKMDVYEQQVLFLNNYSLYVNAKSNVLYRRLKSWSSIPEWTGLGTRAADQEVGRGDIYWELAEKAKEDSLRLAALSSMHCRNDVWED